MPADNLAMNVDTLAQPHNRFLLAVVINVLLAAHFLLALGAYVVGAHQATFRSDAVTYGRCVLGFITLAVIAVDVWVMFRSRKQVANAA